MIGAERGKRLKVAVREQEKPIGEGEYPIDAL